jgi:uncharacterized protein
MMAISARLLYLTLAVLFLGAFNVQPMTERQAQELLPMSVDPTWVLLAKTEVGYDEKTGLYSAKIPEDVTALDGREVTVTGFMLPLESSEKFTHFLLSKRTPTCPFCPPGEPNEVINVTVTEPVEWAEDAVKVTGTFGLMDDREFGMFFKLTKAKIS